MTEGQGYVLGQFGPAARRLEIQDAHFAAMSELLLDELALRPTDRVVELGCGPGGMSRRVLRRLGAEGVLVGVDTSEGLLAERGRRWRGRGRRGSRRCWQTSRGWGRGSTGPTWWSGGRCSTTSRWWNWCWAGSGGGPAGHAGRLHRARLPDAAGPARLPRSDRPAGGGAAPRLVLAINQLYLANRLSPDVGATLARTLEVAGYRKVRAHWWECPSDGLVIENMLMFYDEVRAPAASPRRPHARRDRRAAAPSSWLVARGTAARLGCLPRRL